jgi:lipid-binding SYLF domain-containing protein
MALLTMLALSAVATAAKKDNTEERERARKAAEGLDSIMASPDSEIPADLLSKAHAIAVIPNVVKGAFIAGGRFGKGVVSARGHNGRWGPPVFIDIGGGSIGFQIGVEATDLILVFTEPDGIRALLEDNLKLSAEAGAVAGPVGRHVGAGTNLTFDAPIYTYSRNKGVFAGVSLEGSVVGVDDSSNEEVYGHRGAPPARADPAHGIATGIATKEMGVVHEVQCSVPAFALRHDPGSRSLR